MKQLMKLFDIQKNVDGFYVLISRCDVYAKHEYIAKNKLILVGNGPSTHFYKNAEGNEYIISSEYYENKGVS